MQYVGLICDSRKTKAWNSGKLSTMRSYCMIRCPQIVWSKVVKRNLDDTAAEFLHEKEQLEDREVHRVILKESPAAKRWRRLSKQTEDLDEVETRY